jgi:hypothetical protein
MIFPTTLFNLLARAKVRQINDPGFLKNKDNEGGIETFLKLATSIKITEHPIILPLPTYLEEYHRKTITT